MHEAPGELARLIRADVTEAAPHGQAERCIEIDTNDVI